MNMAMEQATAEHVRREQLARAQWPLRSQWQLVVWTRQGLLFLLSFAMDCVMWLSPYEEHRTTRYVFAALAIAVLGGFWKLQAQRQPYAMRRQHRLEVFLYVVDILVIFLACLYGALTNDGAVLVDDEPIGHLEGFRFVVDPLARAADRKLLLAAAERHLPGLLSARAEALIAANAEDLAAATDLSAAYRDRLTLTPARIAAMATGLEEIAALPDPVGRSLSEWTRPNGVREGFGVWGAQRPE
jgi:hypothetical protein